MPPIDNFDGGMVDTFKDKTVKATPVSKGSGLILHRIWN
jgi:hypothetical protein